MLQCSQVGRSSSMEGPCLLRNETEAFYVVETLGSMARRACSHLGVLQSIRFREFLTRLGLKGSEEISG